jgi:hypothetical protein
VRDALLTRIFGDESWRAALSTLDFHKLCQQVLELYKQKLRAIPRAEYIFSFEMRGGGDTLNYHLVFASQNPLGLEKMKEAMRSIDKSGSYCFSDGAVGQSALFNFDDPKLPAARLYKHFVGRTTACAPVKKFALNETPFINPISMLKVLDQNGQVEITRRDPRSKAFNENIVKSVSFLSIPRPLAKNPPPPKQGELFGH